MSLLSAHLISLAAAGACAWVTRRHLRAEEEEGEPFAPAWLLARARSPRRARRLARWALWAARCAPLVAVALLAQPAARALLAPLQPAQGGALVVVDGPLEISSAWERPLWVAALGEGGELRWLLEGERGDAAPPPPPAAAPAPAGFTLNAPWGPRATG